LAVSMFRPARLAPGYVIILNSESCWQYGEGGKGKGGAVSVTLSHTLLVPSDKLKKGNSGGEGKRGKMSYKEKRESERIMCQLAGAIVVDKGKFDGVIEDMSDSGIRFSTLALTRKIMPSQEARVVFPVFLDETIRLDCSVKWARTDSNSRRIEIGMQITKSEGRYRELLRNIYLSRYL
jgi:hypothetical protein